MRAAGTAITRCRFAVGENTKVEWAHHSFNPWWGCARLSPACRFCYADRDAKRYGHGGLWRRHGPRRMMADSTWRNPIKWNRAAKRACERARVFCASMADVFEPHPDVFEARRRLLLEVIPQTPWLDWLLLTKRPEHVAELVPWGTGWPPNVWLARPAHLRHGSQRLVG